MFKLTQDKVAKIVRILFFLTFIFFLIGILLFVISVITGSQNSIQALLIMITEGGIVFGLYKKEPWVVPMLTLFSTLGVLSGLMQPVNSPLGLSIKLFGLFLNVFYVYFFTRKQVRIFFNTKSEYILGR